MNGGLIFESSTHSPLASAPVLKQELITEHYAITAKRSSQKDKMKRSANMNTSLALGPIPPQPSFVPTLPGQQPQQLQPVYMAEPGGTLYQPLSSQFSTYPSSQSLPGPSRPLSRAEQVSSTGQTASTSGHASQRSHDSTASHKRKRSNSSSHADQLRTPRNNAQQTLPSTVQGLVTGKSHLPTPPSTGDHASTPAQMSQHSPESRQLPESQRSGVYVTATETEGRKLGLVRTSTGMENVEANRKHGPPRTKQATVLSVNSSGVATVASGDVLYTDASYMGEVPKTPPASSSCELAENDTPGTKLDKVKRRLLLFKTTARTPEPMYSTRLDMGHAGPVRVALRKDIAIAFMGLDNVATGGATEEQNAAATREPVRPDWPDDEAPWNQASGRRINKLRQDRERLAMLQRYLETSSDDDDDDHDGAARLQIPTRRHQSRPSAEHKLLPPSQDPTDARAALWYAMHKARMPHRLTGPQMVPTGVVNCVCKNTAPSNQMVSCSNCKSWHHVTCVGRDEAIDGNWACERCVAQARRATLSTPSQRTPSQLSTVDRSMSAFRGNQALALAPSPMFAPEAARAAAYSGMATRTPQTPSRRHERARVLSYGTEWGVTGENPSTPMPQTGFGSFSTPRPDDPVFDVNSTPSRHLDTDPRIAGQFSGSLFAITPLVGRSRNANQLVGDTPLSMGHARNISGVPPAFAEGMTSRHEFLQGLTADRRELPETPGSLGLGRPSELSPSPFGGHRGTSSKSNHPRSASRSGLAFTFPLSDKAKGSSGADGTMRD